MYGLYGKKGITDRLSETANAPGVRSWNRGDYSAKWCNREEMKGFNLTVHTILAVHKTQEGLIEQKSYSPACQLK